MFSVAIIGGENTKDYKFFSETCIKYLKNKANEGITIRSIGDTYIEAFAERYRIPVRFFATDWKKYGTDAYSARNDMLLDKCDGVIVFHDGSKNSSTIVKCAKDKNIPLRIVKNKTI